jgi:hypothetical protein
VFADRDECRWALARGYPDGEEFALPIAARLISARASGTAGDGQADRERQK